MTATLQIGPWSLETNLILAPMAGVTDRPFRHLCRQFGAGMAVSEMITSDQGLWHSRKTRQRMVHLDEPSPRSVQIAGTDPAQMADAARVNVENGAQLIDINMGCPAKKVLKRAAGSALMRDEALVQQILGAVVGAVDIPVTLKIRTGWDAEQRNGVEIAKIAEQAGIQAIAVHGRTRACGFKGDAEYDTIRAIKRAVTIPVIANGDINSAKKAQEVLAHTGADGIMIGRGAHGRPWIFRDILMLLSEGQLPEPICYQDKSRIVRDHISAIHDHYEGIQGVRVARKHIRWYLEEEGLPSTLIRPVFSTNEADDQLEQVDKLYKVLAHCGIRALKESAIHEHIEH